MIKLLLMRAKKQDRTMRSVTGLNREQFHSLALAFQKLLEESKVKPLIRKPGAGRKGALKEVEEKLFFLLFYLKAYPTYDLAGVFLQVDRSQPCRWVQKWLPVLEKTLGRTLDLPKRKIRSVQEFIEAFPEIHDIFIDSTERASRRPSSYKNLARRYSGKKKMHTRKNTLITDEHKRIRFLSSTKNGSLHDFTLLKKEAITVNIPKGICVWVDKGYTGIKSILAEGISCCIPKKMSKKHPLTQAEKQENQIISSIRMPVEHAIGGMKRFACMQTKIRNKNWNIEDSMPLLCAGLWNFHLSQSENVK